MVEKSHGVAAPDDTVRIGDGKADSNNCDVPGDKPCGKLQTVGQGDCDRCRVRAECLRAWNGSHTLARRYTPSPSVLRSLVVFSDHHQGDMPCLRGRGK